MHLGLVGILVDDDFDGKTFQKFHIATAVLKLKPNFENQRYQRLLAYSCRLRVDIEFLCGGNLVETTQNTVFSPNSPAETEAGPIDVIFLFNSCTQ